MNPILSAWPITQKCSLWYWRQTHTSECHGTACPLSGWFNSCSVIQIINDRFILGKVVEDVKASSLKIWTLRQSLLLLSYFLSSDNLAIRPCCEQREVCCLGELCRQSPCNDGGLTIEDMSCIRVMVHQSHFFSSKIRVQEIAKREAFMIYGTMYSKSYYLFVFSFVFSEPSIDLLFLLIWKLFLYCLINFVPYVCRFKIFSFPIIFYECP